MNFETISIFISSTFSDMHAERNYLVEYVFPKLREWCEKRRLYLNDIDLRWGITSEDSQTNNTIRVCLDRVDACRPFFLCFLGQRRGSVFGKDQISEESYEKYPELRERGDSRSVTELEIEHALLAPMIERVNNQEIRHEKSRRALFFLRDDPFKNIALSSTHRKIYTNDGANDPAEAEEKHESFKALIKEKCDHVTAYQCRFDPDKTSPELRYWTSDPTMPSAEEGRLTDFRVNGEPLCDVIIRQLQEMILLEYPDRKNEDETLTPSESEIHSLIQKRFTQFFIHRKGAFDNLWEYVHSDQKSILLLTAPGGAGKTALLANFAEDVANSVQNDLRIFLRFCGMTKESLKFTDVLRSIFESEKIDLPPDDESFQNGLPGFFASLSQKGKTLIILDDITRTAESINALSLLPQTLPNGIWIIASLRETADMADLIEGHRRRLNAKVTHIEPFDRDEKEQLIEGFLDRNLKKLDDKQASYLCSRPSTDNPLYLGIILRELKTYGVYDEVLEEIGRFGETPEDAFAHLLDRLEQKVYDFYYDMRGAADYLFSLLCFSRAGIRKSDLLILMTQRFGQNCKECMEFILKCVRDYLSNVFFATAESKINFLYDSFRLAARERFHDNETEIRNTLAGIFESSDPEEASWQLRLAGNRIRIGELYSDPAFLTRFCQQSGGWRMMDEADQVGEGILSDELYECLHICTKALTDHPEQAPQIFYKESTNPIFRLKAKTLISDNWLRFEPVEGTRRQTDSIHEERMLSPQLESRSLTDAAATIRCFSPEADLAFLLLRPRVVTVFRMSTVERLFDMPLQDDPERILASDDGRYFATVYADGGLSIFELIRNDRDFLLQSVHQDCCLKVRFKGICAYAVSDAIVWQTKQHQLKFWKGSQEISLGEHEAQLTGAWRFNSLMTAWKTPDGCVLRNEYNTLSLDAAINDLCLWNDQLYIAVKTNLVYVTDPASLKIRKTIKTENPLYSFAIYNDRLLATDEEYSLELITKQDTAVNLGNINYSDGSVHTNSFEHIRSCENSVFYCSDSVCAKLVLKAGEQTHAKERFLNAVRDEDRKAVYETFEGQFSSCQAEDLLYKIEDRKKLSVYTADGKKTGSVSLDESLSGQHILTPLGRKVAVLTVRASVRKLFSSVVRSVLTVYEGTKCLHRREFDPDENIVALYPDNNRLWIRGSDGFEIVECGHGFKTRKIPFSFSGFDLHAPAAISDTGPVMLRSSTGELCAISGTDGKILASFPMSRRIDSLKRGNGGELCLVSEHGKCTYQVYKEEVTQ